ncbi:PHD and RING finger domain-containing protein 1 [Caerostris darwini]|uniref:PHD and RING finger domain-containing protein 1 n=1 Tax=Caerostris darwini TaxID=1538125 RepID=A0AAV4S9A5_9ARAC|nr:PHD and RING finger domain-containing protein 1 [Caerostris darwini]
MHPKQPQFADVANVSPSKCYDGPLLGRSPFLIRDDSSARKQIDIRIIIDSTVRMSEVEKTEHGNEECSNGKNDKELKIIKDNNFDGKDELERCSVCLEYFKGQDLGNPECCEHVFCFECINLWSEVRNSCPIDRCAFDFIYVKKTPTGEILKKVKVDTKYRLYDEIDLDPDQLMREAEAIVSHIVRVNGLDSYLIRLSQAAHQRSSLNDIPEFNGPITRSRSRLNPYLRNRIRPNPYPRTRTRRSRRSRY